MIGRDTERARDRVRGRSRERRVEEPVLSGFTLVHTDAYLCRALSTIRVIRPSGKKFLERLLNSTLPSQVQNQNQTFHGTKKQI